MDRADLEHWRPRDVARLLALVEGQRQYFQEIVAALPVGVLVLSAELEIVLANNAVRELFKLPEQGALKNRVDTLLPVWVIQRTEQVLKTGAAEANLLVEAEPGRLRVGIQSITGWESEGAREALLIIEHIVPPQASGVVQDRTTTVPVQAGASANVSAAGIAGEAPAVLWTVDPRSMRPLSVSPQAEEVLGFSASFLMSNPSFWINRVHPGDRERVTQFYRSAAESQHESACEFRAVRSDGRVIWLRETVRTVKQGRTAVHLAGFSVDVSERRLLEAQLVQSERIEALQKLTSRVSHDLNNALMILQGNAEEVLQGLPANSDVRGEMEAVVAAARRLSGMAGHLLAFSRRPPMPTEPIDLEAVLSAARQALKLQRTGTLSRGRVLANTAGLDQTLTAVVQAVRSNLPQDGVVTLETSSLEIREELQADNAPLRRGEYIALTIAASDAKFGSDIAVPVFEHILPEKDSRGDGGARLAEAYNLVRQWGGDIAAAGGAGEESPAFRIFLRRANGGSDVETASAETRGDAQQRATILLVEDEAGIRALVERFLRKHGYEVLEASNGEQALAVMHERRGPVDLLVTDMMMPQMGGRELVDRLVQLGYALKVLYISGYTDDASVYARELPAGSDFLQKPFTLSALLDKVRALLG